MAGRAVRMGGSEECRVPTLTTSTTDPHSDLQLPLRLGHYRHCDLPQFKHSMRASSAINSVFHTVT
jgi:hypothetical protein